MVVHDTKHWHENLRSSGDHQMQSSQYSVCQGTCTGTCFDIFCTENWSHAHNIWLKYFSVSTPPPTRHFIQSFHILTTSLRFLFYFQSHSMQWSIWLMSIFNLTLWSFISSYQKILKTGANAKIWTQHQCPYPKKQLSLLVFSLADHVHRLS